MRCPKCKGLSYETRLLLGREIAIGITCPICGLWTELGPTIIKPEIPPKEIIASVAIRKLAEHEKRALKVEKLKAKLAALEARQAA